MTSRGGVPEVYWELAFVATRGQIDKRPATESRSCALAVLASVALPPSYVAAGLLLGRAIAEHCDLASPPVDEILAATGASKSHAYEVLHKLDALTPTLVRAPGRPAKEAPEPDTTEAAAITHAVLDFVMQHPGCVDRGAEKQRYNVLAMVMLLPAKCVSQPHVPPNARKSSGIR